jgi:hypothetical protein
MTDAQYLAAERRRITRLAFLVLAVVAFVHVSGIGEGCLYLAPALALAALLLGGKYPGERLIERLGRSRQPRPANCHGSPRPRRPREPRVPSGGLLIAFALAGRAPPRWSFAQRPPRQQGEKVEQENSGRSFR